MLAFSLLPSKDQKIIDVLKMGTYWRLGNTVIIVFIRQLENKNVALFYLMIRKCVSTLNTSFTIVNVAVNCLVKSKAPSIHLFCISFFFAYA